MLEKTPLLPRGEPVTQAPGRTRPWILVLYLFAFALTIRTVTLMLEPLTSELFVGNKFKKLCLTPECIHASSELLHNLSPNHKELDPCTDFEELVCGGWRDRHDLREDQGDAFTGTIMSENSDLLLKHILEAPYPNASDHSSFSPMQLGTTSKSTDEENFDLMKTAYSACLNENAIKEQGVAPLMAVLRQIEEAFGWAVAPDGLERYASSGLRKTILLLATSGVSALVSTGAGADDKDPDSVVVQVSPPWSIGLPSKERYEDDKLVAKYESVVAETLGNLYHKDQSLAAKQILKLEKALAAASPSTEDAQDVTKYYNPYSIDEAAKLAPQIDLKSILEDLADGRALSKKIIVASPHYMRNLSDIISQTQPSVMQNYFLWKTIQAFTPYVEADEVKPYNRFRNELAGRDPDSLPERWRTCIGHVDGGIGWILSRFFVEKAFSAKAKKFGDTIVSDIKDQFAIKLKKTKWMSKDVIDKALKKVHNIVQKIGYPTKSPDIMDPKDLRDYYKDLDLTEGNFFANGVAMRQLAVRQEWSALGKPVDRNEWGMTVPTVNAYYNPPGNEIVFPAGIMQFPVFDVNVPAYISYGAFGSVAGHELSHAFDSTGRHYDENGNYTDWWTDSTVRAFKERAECFVDQYHNYTVPGPDGKPLHVNGRLTLGENIADAGGLSASFQAWKMHSKQHKYQNLPGLGHFTQDQLFFVSYSNWWCGKTRRETAINRIYVDPHAPKWARILGTMSNSREFREAFKCPVKKPTCELW